MTPRADDAARYDRLLFGLAGEVRRDALGRPVYHPLGLTRGGYLLRSERELERVYRSARRLAWTCLALSVALASLRLERAVFVLLLVPVAERALARRALRDHERVAPLPAAQAARLQVRELGPGAMARALLMPMLLLGSWLWLVASERWGVLFGLATGVVTLWTAAGALYRYRIWRALRRDPFDAS